MLYHNLLKRDGENMVELKVDKRLLEMMKAQQALAQYYENIAKEAERIRKLPWSSIAQSIAQYQSRISSLGPLLSQLTLTTEWFQKYKNEIESSYFFRYKEMNSILESIREPIIKTPLEKYSLIRQEDLEEIKAMLTEINRKLEKLIGSEMNEEDAKKIKKGFEDLKEKIEVMYA